MFVAAPHAVRRGQQNVVFRDELRTGRVVDPVAGVEELSAIFIGRLSHIDSCSGREPLGLGCGHVAAVVFGNGPVAPLLGPVAFTRLIGGQQRLVGLPAGEIGGPGTAARNQPAKQRQ